MEQSQLTQLKTLFDEKIHEMNRLNAEISKLLEDSLFQAIHQLVALPQSSFTWEDIFLDRDDLISVACHITVTPSDTISPFMNLLLFEGEQGATLDRQVIEPVLFKLPFESAFKDADTIADSILKQAVNTIAPHLTQFDITELSEVQIASMSNFYVETLQ